MEVLSDDLADGRCRMTTDGQSCTDGFNSMRVNEGDVDGRSSAALHFQLPCGCWQKQQPPSCTQAFKRLYSSITCDTDMVFSAFSAMAVNSERFFFRGMTTVCLTRNSARRNGAALPLPGRRCTGKPFVVTSFLASNSYASFGTYCHRTAVLGCHTTPTHVHTLRSRTHRLL